MSVKVSKGRLLVDEKPVSLFSASFQYWRVAREKWKVILEKIRELGFGIVETYVPWSVHELRPGEYDFGREEPKKDIRGFVEACLDQNLYVILRPGPHINAELTYFGFPERLFDNPEMLCRSATGAPVYLPAAPRMFPALCYHNPAFLSEFETYIKNLASTIKDLIHPSGPIIAFQVDNECCKFFRAHPFDHDYSKYSILLYRKFLKEKYKSLDELIAAHGKQYDSWNVIEPPRSFKPSNPKELPFYMDWIEYGEYYINESLRSIHGILKRHFGEDVAYFHNFPCVFPLTPLDLHGSELFLDFQSVDMYPSNNSYDILRRGAKYVSVMSRLPHLAEFASGNLFMGAPLTLDDHRFTSKAAIMHGFKGINYYMIVERERWYGSPIRNDGTVREEHCQFFREFLAYAKWLCIDESNPRRDVCLLVIREYERLADAATLIPPLSRMALNAVALERAPRSLFISEEKYGFSEPIAERYLRIFDFWYRMLSSCGTHFAIAEPVLGIEKLGKFKMVVAPTFEFMNEEAQTVLLEYSKKGGNLVIGPRAPLLNERMEPTLLLAKYVDKPEERRERAEVFGAEFEEVSFFRDPKNPGNSNREHNLTIICEKQNEEGKVIFFGALPPSSMDSEFFEMLKPFVETLLMRAGIEPSYIPSDPRIDVSVFDESGKKILFLANPTSESITTWVHRAQPGTYLNLENGQTVDSSGSFEISLGPREIVALERVE